MKITNLIFLTLACFTSCGRHAEISETIAPATAVTLTHVSYGNLPNDIILSATTAYLNKSIVSAPIAAYITNVYAQPGDWVKAGQPLYELESKEQHALSSIMTRPITVRAGKDGILLNVLQQAGDYVPEGTTLCTLAENGSLVFLLNVPYEEAKYTTVGKTCTLILPDDTRLTATIGNPLATMNVISQSQPVIAYADAPFLPEGMNVKVLLPESTPEGKAMILPKSAVQSNEELTAHWVMKLADDSTAVRVPVEVGGVTADSVEVRGALTPEDRIVLTGGYALPDSGRVSVHRITDMNK